MSDQLPAGHISDSLKLDADGRVTLFELTPSVGSGVFRFKEGADATWLSNLYQGVGMGFSGDRRSGDGTSALPKLTIGGDNMDLGALKPLLFDGSIDGGLVRRAQLLLDDLVNNRNISFDTWYRVKRVEDYSSRKVGIVLAPYAESFGAKLPRRKFVPPAFPYVSLR
jgi:phage-related protein